ncbi:MAG: hypothetical protein AB7O96_19105 [Pseudobdellovibrionaceae bacterium]
MKDRLKFSLLMLRLGVFIVMLFWTIDKFLRPEHAATVYEHFYLLPGWEQTAMTAIGIAELILIFGFLLGVKKRFTYGSILLLHTVSTFSSYKQYLDPFDKGNLLFFAAWPMLSACLTLYLLRDEDTLLTAFRATRRDL